MQTEFSIEEVEGVKAIHIKKYIQHRQQIAKEKAITIYNNIAEIANGVSLLASEKASFITGHNMDVTGGSHL